MTTAILFVIALLSAQAAALQAGGSLQGSLARTAVSPAVGRWRCAADDGAGRGFGGAAATPSGKAPSKKQAKRSAKKQPAVSAASAQPQKYESA